MITKKFRHASGKRRRNPIVPLIGAFTVAASLVTVPGASAQSPNATQDYYDWMARTKVERAPIAQSAEACEWLRGVPPKAPDVKELIRDFIFVRPQDQYEPVEAYQNRLNSVFSNQMPHDKHVWVTARINQSVGKYDLENQKLIFLEHELEGGMIMVSAAAPDYMFPESYHGAIATTEVDKQGTFLAQNAFGASAKVTTLETTQYGIGFLGVDFRKMSSAYTNIAIAMKPDVARQQRPFLELVVGGEVSGYEHLDKGAEASRNPKTDKRSLGYVWQAGTFEEATFDDPRQVRTQTNLLVISNPCGMIRNAVTKEVLAVIGLPSIAQHF